MSLTVQKLYGLLLRSQLLPADDAQAMFTRWQQEARGEANDTGKFAAWMVALFGADAGAEPALDRTPLPPSARRKSADDTLEALTLGAEADLDAEAIEGARRSRRRALIGIMLLLLLGAIAVTAWAVVRPRAEHGEAPAVIEVG